MKFQNKCLLQSLFSGVPYGHLLNYAMQRYVTKSLPQSERRFKERYDNAVRHRDVYEKSAVKPISESTCYEFGAGWDLMYPLVFSSFGFSQIYCIDILPHVSPFLLNHTVKLLAMMKDTGKIEKVGGGGQFCEAKFSQCAEIQVSNRLQSPDECGRDAYAGWFRRFFLFEQLVGTYSAKRHSSHPQGVSPCSRQDGCCVAENRLWRSLVLFRQVDFTVQLSSLFVERMEAVQSFVAIPESVAAQRLSLALGGKRIPIAGRHTVLSCSDRDGCLEIVAFGRRIPSLFPRRLKYYGRLVCCLSFVKLPL